MDKFDFYMTIIELGITKTEMAEELNVERPTLDKAIGQFIEDNECKNPRIMILFSRLQKYEYVTKEILENEIQLSLEYMNELNERFNEICEGADIELETNDLKEESNERSEKANRDSYENENSVQKQIYKPKRGKSKKNPKHTVGQVVECTIVKELDIGYLLAFDHVKGVIQLSDFPELEKGSEFDKEEKYKAVITRINGKHYYLKREV